VEIAVVRDHWVGILVRQEDRSSQAEAVRRGSRVLGQSHLGADRSLVRTDHWEGSSHQMEVVEGSRAGRRDRLEVDLAAEELVARRSKLQSVR
jgi:hypothetical protein